jgi:hypothetical protein
MRQLTRREEASLALGSGDAPSQPNGTLNTTTSAMTSPVYTESAASTRLLAVPGPTLVSSEQEQDSFSSPCRIRTSRRYAVWSTYKTPQCPLLSRVFQLDLTCNVESNKSKHITSLPYHQHASQRRRIWRQRAIRRRRDSSWHEWRCTSILSLMFQEEKYLTPIGNTTAHEACGTHAAARGRRR